MASFGGHSSETVGPNALKFGTQAAMDGSCRRRELEGNRKKANNLMKELRFLSNPTGLNHYRLGLNLFIYRQHVRYFRNDRKDVVGGHLSSGVTIIFVAPANIRCER